MIRDTAATVDARDCSGMSEPARQIDEVPGYAETISTGRRAKHEYLRTAPGSPIRQAAVEPHALSHFPVDERYRIVVPRLRRPASDDRPTILETNDGHQRVARRVGFLDFDLHSQQLTLTGFSVGSTPPGFLFVPFADATSGTETYGSGRYLDAEMSSDGSVVLDFNLAYQPYCAYSPAYSCPMTPAENRLAVPILAGERLRR